MTGIFPNDTVVLRPVRAIRVEGNDAWAVNERRDLPDDSMTPIDAVGCGEPVEEDAPLVITA